MDFSKTHTGGRNMSERYPRLCIAIVNYKTPEITRLCLKHIRGNVDLSNAEVWVVDNHSEDESTRYLRAQDWIHLIERIPDENERGRESHALGLDRILYATEAPHILCIHTDTFIHDGRLIAYMQDTMLEHNAVAVGTVEQVHRGPIRQATRRMKYMMKGLRLQLQGKPVKPSKTLLKSHCCLWNADEMRAKKRYFSGGYNPGEAAQRAFEAEGSRVKAVPTGDVFRYMTHIHSGTLVERGQHSKNRRRKSAYARLISQ